MSAVNPEADIQEIRRLVELAVRRYLQREGVEIVGRSCGLPAGEGKPVAVVFTGSVAALDTVLGQLASLAPRNVELTAVLSHSAQELIGEQRLREAGCFQSLCPATDTAAARRFVADCKLLVAPTLTSHTAAKVALGLLDSLPAQLLVQALAAGTPVVAVADGADPRSETWMYRGLRENVPSLARLLTGYLNGIQRHGVQVVPAEELCDTCVRALGGNAGKNLRADRTRNIITADEVEEAADKGFLRVGPRAIITHAARDLAAELGVELLE